MNAEDHPLRASLTHEVHARPFESMTAPCVVDRLVFLVDPNARVQDVEHISSLARALGVAPPEAHASHARLAAGSIRVLWERHTEFVSYTFIRSLTSVDEVPASLAQGFDAQWLAQTPGERLSVSRVWVWAEPADDTLLRARARLHEQSMVGASLGSGRHRVLTDFRMGHDGAVHYLLGADPDVAPARLGRIVQRLLELETYRMMALLGLPAARAASASLAEGERAIAALTDAIRTAGHADEGHLLQAVTAQAAELQAVYAATDTRLAASAAYFALVDARLAELRETPFAELLTLAEFLRRRLTPARDTCRATSARLHSLSQRVMQVSGLLRTRVELAQLQSQNALLHTMTRRQELQLKLQSTVEGLSVVAITYYGASVVGLLAKGADELGWPVSPALATAFAVPIIAVGTWLLVRRVHHRLQRAIED
ncbi:MAG: DUF3422 domain-containing protein [Burkholderiaceae bacterium]